MTKTNKQSLIRVGILALLAMLVIGAQFTITMFTSGPHRLTEAAQVAYPTPLAKDNIAAPSTIEDAPASLRQVGSPAIQPSIKDAAPNQAAFTEADVVRYAEVYQAQLNSQGQHGIWGYPSDTPVKIAKVEFLTLSDLKKRHPYIEPNVPADTLLCYIQYTGTFKQENERAGTPIQRTIAFEVLNAQTGNRLAYGLDIQLR